MKRYLKIIFLVAVSTFALIQCQSNKKEKLSQDFLKERITKMDDSLKGLYQKMMNNPSAKIPSSAIYETVNRYLEYYRNYPKDSYSATCLDKVQQLYLQEKEYKKSLNYTDTLLWKYPKYKKRASLLLNAGATCDVINDRVNVKKYYSMLLKENPHLNKETKEMVEFRLEHINLSFDELVKLQIKQNVEKN